MELREVLTRCAALWLEHERETRPLGTKMTLSDKEINDFLAEATARTDADLVFDQIDDLLNTLAVQYPLRTVKIRRELKWLRKQAKKRGMTWGRR
jgi:hypothetical protein